MNIVELVSFCKYWVGFEVFQEIIMGITTPVLFCYIICYPWYVLACPVLMSESPYFGRLCICIILFLCIHDIRWTPLSLDYLFSLIRCLGVLKLCTICRLVIYFYIHLCFVSRFAAGPHLPSVAWDFVLFCHVISCSILLTLLIMYGRERMDSIWLFLLIMIYYTFMLVLFCMLSKHCSAFIEWF